MHVTTNGVSSPDNSVTPIKEAGGFRISLLAKGILAGLTILSLGAAIASAVLFFHLSIGIALIALIASSCAFALFGTMVLYPAIEKWVPAPIQSIANGVSSIAKEAFCIPLVLFLMAGQGIFGRKKEPTQETHPDPDNVVLMIHGYVGTSAHFSYLRYRLEKNEVGALFTIDLGNPFLSINEYATRVEEKVQKIQAEYPGKKITLIGHSMGGVVASCYVGSCAKTDHLQKVITLGSPLQGSHMTKIVPGVCAREMDRHSDYLAKVDQDAQKKAVDFACVGSTTDLIIVPNSATSFATQTTNRRSETLPGMGHATYLFSDKVVSLLLQEIRS